MKIDNDKDVLLVVDVQVDHANGPIPHAGADDIMEPINRVAGLFEHIVIINDWHPPGHISFASAHGDLEHFSSVDTYYGKQFVFGDHCVQGTEGAKLDPRLRLDKAELEFRKGWKKGVDAPSGFHHLDGKTSGLGDVLRARGYTRVFGVGLGGCLRMTLHGARKEGFEAILIEDCAAFNWSAFGGGAEAVPRHVARANQEMAEDAIGIITSDILEA